MIIETNTYRLKELRCPATNMQLGYYLHVDDELPTIYHPKIMQEILYIAKRLGLTNYPDTEECKVDKSEFINSGDGIGFLLSKIV